MICVIQYNLIFAMKLVDHPEQLAGERNPASNSIQVESIRELGVCCGGWAVYVYC